MVLHIHYWRRHGHIPVMLVLQIVFIVLFAVFVVYEPTTAEYHAKFGSKVRAKELMRDYPRESIRVNLSTA